MTDLGHDIIDVGDGSEICSRCRIEGSALSVVKCGDIAGAARFEKAREREFLSVLRDAELQCAFYGTAKLRNLRQAPRLKKMLTERFEWATGKKWEDVK